MGAAPTHLRSLQALRAVAALMVVALHVGLVEQRFAGGQSLNLRFGEAGAAGVDLFFVLSGFIMVHVTRDVAGGARDAARFLFARAARIYPTHWATSLPLLAIFLAAPALINSSQATTDIAASFLLYPADGAPLNPVAWTLVHEMYFYVVFAGLVLVAPPRWRFAALAGWAGLAAAGSFVFGPEANAWPRYIFHPLSAEFFLGACAAVASRRLPAHAAPMVLAAGGALFIAALVWRGVLDPDPTFPARWERVLLFAPGAALIVAGAAAWERARSIAVPRWLEHLGDASYAIYLAHLPVIVAVGRGWAEVRLDGLADNIVAAIVMAAAGVAAGLIVHRFIERPLLIAAKGLRRRLNRALGGVDQP